MTSSRSNAIGQESTSCEKIHDIAVGTMEKKVQLAHRRVDLNKLKESRPIPMFSLGNWREMSPLKRSQGHHDA